MQVLFEFVFQQKMNQRIEESASHFIAAVEKSNCNNEHLFRGQLQVVKICNISEYGWLCELSNLIGKGTMTQ